MIRLTNGADSLIVMPEHGGAIAGWTRAGTHVLRRPGPDAILSGHSGAMGCFPLLPWCNRIAHRHFSWEGQTHTLAANFGDHPHAIHGVGWQRPWTVETVTNDAVVLFLRHDPDPSWPFAFEATLTYRLTASGLAMRLAATNRHDAAAPMGLGVHPYFPRGAGDGLRFRAKGMWHNIDSLPAKHAPLQGGWDQAVDDAPLDNCFTGWAGTAHLPGLTIQADPVFGNLQVFTPANADFFCVEPVSHIPDAINRPGLDDGQAMAMLSPGQSLSGTVTLSP